MRACVPTTQDGNTFHMVYNRLPGGPLFLGVSLKQGTRVEIVSAKATQGPPATAATAGAAAAAAPAAAGRQGVGDKWSSTHSSTIRVEGSGRATRFRAGNNSRTVLGEQVLRSGRGTWTVKPINGTCIVGIARDSVYLEKWVGADGNGWGYDGSDGQKAHGSNWAQYAARFRAGATITVDVDLDAHTVAFSVRRICVPACFVVQ